MVQHGAKKGDEPSPDHLLGGGYDTSVRSCADKKCAGAKRHANRSSLRDTEIDTLMI
jgi:hypothetical protein